MKTDKAAPIGVFDSGLGGLTAVKELHKLLPGENIVYFGDTGRVPYGNRGADTIIAYTRQDLAFLLSKNVKTILAACGTVSTVYGDRSSDQLPVFYTGVLHATAKAAVAQTKSGKIGIIGTQATIASGGYQQALADIDPRIACTAAACPLFVPLVENGHFARHDAMAQLAAEEYLRPIKAAGVDTLIMGCTHYPLLEPLLNDQLDGKVTLIDPGKQASLALKEYLRAQNLLNPRVKNGRCDYYVTDAPENFNHLAKIFLGPEEDVQAQRIPIDSYQLDWILKGWQVGID